MDTEFIIPRFFHQQQQFDLLEIDDFSCVEYRHCQEQRQNRILVTSYLFVVVLSGRKIIHTEEGDLHIEAGNAFFARKGSYLFSEILSKEDEYRTLIFFIDDSFLAGFLRRHPPRLQGASPAVPIFQVQVTPLLRSGIDSLLPYFLHNSKFSRELLHLKLDELLLLISEADAEGNFQGFLQELHSSRRQSILRVMEQYYGRPVSIAELAALSGRSLSTFKREFKELFQETPKRWINKRRLDEARFLFGTSDMTVSEICFAVGFENISYFSQLFRKQFGCSPSEIKRDLNEQELSRI